MYLITNGQVITEDGILAQHEVLIEKDRIIQIAPSRTCERSKVERIIDAEGGYISPGFIDIHADFIETMASPRPTSVIDFELSIRETEKILVAQGITTMFHSLSFYKKDEFGHKPIRELQNVSQLLDKIHETNERHHLMRHHFHARFEIDALEQIDYLKQCIEEDKVQLLSFMDHTPGQGQYRDLEMYRKTLKGYQDLTDESINQIIEETQNKEKMTMEMLEEIITLAHSKGIAIASHDDDSFEKVELVKSLGVAISEFPITLDVALYAKQKGMYTIAGAPNILLGGSHSGNLSVEEAICNEAIDILCSDYYPAALLHALFEMNKKHDIDLAQMFKMVTINPAKAVHMEENIGSIAVGKKADIIVIQKLDNDMPVIVYTLVDGKIISCFNYKNQNL